MFSLPGRLKNRIKFEVERFILFRTLHQFFLIAVVIALIALIGGIAVWLMTDDFQSVTEAIWWSFLRLTDPGYIGDDVGGVKRTISTIVSILGYVIFLGALVAVMTQSLNQSITRLQRGLTPIAQNDHILILGWTNRTPIIIQQLLLSKTRVANFLRRRGASDLQIVILAEEVTQSMMLDLRSFLGSYWRARQITLRSGTPLRLEHLERVDFRHASVIILPGGDFGNDMLEYPDGETIKTLLSMGRAEEHLPLMVAEIRDYRKGMIARNAYGGPIEVLESDLFQARLISQIIRVPGLSHIYYELLTHEIGNEIYLRSYPNLTGELLGDLQNRFDEALLLGLYRNDAQRFYPLTSLLDERLVEGDRLVLITPGARVEDLPQEDRLANRGVAVADRENTVRPGHPGSSRKEHRILLLGWNRSVPALLAVLDGYTDTDYSLTSLALLSEEERQTRLRRRGISLNNIRTKWVVGEFTSAPEVEAQEPWDYDTVVICASEWLESSGESDARTVLGYLILESILEGGMERPHLLAQLLNERNASLFPEDRCETITGPVVLSHLLAQIGLQRDLKGLFDELFGPGGAEIFFRPITEYIKGREGLSITFGELHQMVLERGEIAIGVRHQRFASVNGGIILNPERSGMLQLDPEDEVVLLIDEG